MTVKNLIRLVVGLVLIFLPLAAWWCCLRSPPPKQVVIATGRVDGRYAEISQALAERIETELRMPVKLLPSNGSLDNLLHIERGTADFAFYQPGTRETLREHGPDVAEPVATLFEQATAGKAAFVANVYSQPAHFIVRRGAGITSPADMKGKRHRVSLGLSNSGDLAMSLALLDHFNLDPQSDVDAKIGLDYVDIERRQMPLDESASGEDVGELQGLLDEVTSLRQEALSTFTAHHLNEDRGAECFIHMCHALSDKINSKLTRQQQSRLFGELAAAVRAGTSSGP